MTVIQTRHLLGPALAWAVAQAEQEDVVFDGADMRFAPGQFSDEEIYAPYASWEQGGPIIDRRRITLSYAYPRFMTDTTQSVAQYFEPPHSALEIHRQFGPEPLVAGMRCRVAGHFGRQVEVPDDIAAVSYIPPNSRIAA